jgi:3',5'-nucleoside bisphosphate phosphatase
MSGAMRFELHCHSTRSDGTDEPSVVAALAKDRGVDVFAMTDHDTCTHVEGPGTTIRGSEISCDDPESGRTIHILAYDRGGTGWEALETRLVELAEGRRNRLRVMAARLAQRGIRVDVEPLIAAAATSGRSVGRPDLARLMLASGVVTSMKDAFARHLYDGGPVDVPHHALSVTSALALGRAAGAAMSLAHPHVYDHVAVALLRRHRNDGLEGVEAFYGSYDPRERSRWLSLADELDLVTTAGSDWHGPSEASCQVGVDVPAARAEKLSAWLATSR